METQNEYSAIKHLPSNPGLKHRYGLIQDVVYSQADEKANRLTLICPWSIAFRPQTDPVLDPDESYPLLVFLQGSGFTSPDLNYEIPQLVSYAQMGYIVATISHRNRNEGFRSPIYLKDVKCAIRFLKKNAQEYGINPERVAVVGTSSGGNTAMLVGMTADDPRFETPEYAEYSDSVCAVVNCFGPNNMVTFLQDADTVEWKAEIVRTLFDEDPKTRKKQMEEVSPYHLATEGRAYPPFLLLHGDKDSFVDVSQATTMYEKFMEIHAKAELGIVEGADHEADFWSDEVHEVIRSFLKMYLG